MDTAVAFLIIASVPAATLFPIVYGLTLPWWRTLIGRALLVKSVAVALLIDLALLVRVLHFNEFWTDVVRVVLFALICLGVNMQTTALLNEKYGLADKIRDRFRRKVAQA